MDPTEAWKTLVNGLPDPAFGLSRGTISFANQRAGQLFGFSHDTLPLPERLIPSEADRKLLDEVPDGDAIEITCRQADGDVFLADVRCQTIEGSDPPVRLCVARRLDMSSDDWKRCKSAVDLFHLGLFDHDQVTDHLWGSLGHRTLYGVSPDEPLTIPRLLQGLHPEDFDLVAPAIAAAHDPTGDGRFDVEHRVIWPNGEIHWIRTLSQTYFGEIDGEKRPVRTIGASADQTARKDAERETARIVAVLEASPDFVAISTEDASLLYLNRAARKLLGVTDGDELSKLSLTDPYTDVSRQLLLSKGLPAARRDGVWTGEATVRGKDGREVPVSLVVLAHFRADDTLERYATIARDLTREKQLEEQLLHSQKMEALGRVAGGAAHDFNNLLSVIITGTDYALSHLPAESGAHKELLGVMEASRRATDLTQQMLTFSRKQAMPEGVIVDMNDVIMGMMPIVTRIVGKRIELSLDLMETPGTIKADPSQIEQVILNLVVNARDAMPRGGTLTLSTTLVSIDDTQVYSDIEPGSYVVLNVDDNGSGMDPVTKAHIFEPFFTTKELGEGTGLGLSTVFGIVQQARGTIRVHSELGRGTHFAISIPRAESPGTPTKSREPGRGLSAESPDQRRARPSTRSGVSAGS